MKLPQFRNKGFTFNHKYFIGFGINLRRFGILYEYCTNWSAHKIYIGPLWFCYYKYDRSD